MTLTIISGTRKAVDPREDGDSPYGSASYRNAVQVPVKTPGDLGERQRLMRIALAEMSRSGYYTLKGNTGVASGSNWSSWGA